MIEKYLDLKLTNEIKQEIVEEFVKTNKKLNTFIKVKNFVCKDERIKYNSKKSMFSKVELSSLSNLENPALEEVIIDLKEENIKLKKEIEFLRKEIEFLRKEITTSSKKESSYSKEDFFNFELKKEKNYSMDINLFKIEEEKEIEENLSELSIAELKIEDVFGTIVKEKPLRENYSSFKEYELEKRMWEMQELFRLEQLEQLEELNELEDEEKENNIVDELYFSLNNQSIKNELINIKKIIDFIPNKNEVSIFPMMFKEAFEYYNSKPFNNPFVTERKQLSNYGKWQIITLYMSSLNYKLVEIKNKTSVLLFKKNKE